jgi:hypothetical protein
MIWTKILVSDAGREGPPGKQTYRRFFKFVQSERLSDYHRALGALCLAIACGNRTDVQTGCLELGLVDLVWSVFSTSRHVLLRWTVGLLCAEACRVCEKVAYAILHSRAADVLLSALEDPSPEVRASAVYAFGNIHAAVPPLNARTGFSRRRTMNYSQQPNVFGGIYERTINYMQQPNVLSKLRDSSAVSP